MNKINKLVVGVSCVLMLGGCAKTVSASEAAKVADGLKFSDVKATSGSAVIKVEKVETTGDNTSAILNLIGVEEGKSETKEINSGLVAYFVSSTEITALGDTNTTYTVDGTAITIENKVSSELSLLGASVSTVTVTKKEYRSDGMLTKTVVNGSYTLSESSVTTKIVTTYTWNA